ncbi:MAG TPA: zinc-dependent metalloprotease family protein [Saprospiraceae bacterium]|nr:zinc-dependent metalloprotease family protein [Saprospiraceae bacterium]
MKKFLILASVIFLCNSLSAQQYWKEIKNPATIKDYGEYKISISSFKVYTLDVNALEAAFLKTPDREDFAHNTKKFSFPIPMPDGSILNVNVNRASVLHRDLASKYPGISSFCGKGIEDPTAYLRCDFSPEGFHGMILSGKYGTVFIDPLIMNGKTVYVVYQKDNYNRLKKEPFLCHLEDDIHKQLNDDKISTAKVRELPDCTLRKYRLALACTGEYAAFHGGTKAKVLAAMNTTMTRVSGVYEVDLAVTFEIIANNDTLIFLDSATDPYTNDDGGTMLDENQNEVDDVIGVSNYDIGHVFSTGGGGIASLFAVCTPGNKAMGVTGSDTPIGDGFDIDYVAHEMGHEFNANHTFNNDCDGNINNGTAYEPGSGTTIMGYAGVCDPNVLFHSDAYFHVISLDEISTYITKQNGNNCGLKISLGNSAPTVEAGPNRIIPRSTPFELTAKGSDIDNDSLTYCWEQFDKESTPQPPTNAAVGGPVFRSFNPEANPTRVFPMISTIVNGSTSIWEVLPNVARNMNFRVTARDNHNAGGCYATDGLSLTVAANAGPFIVTLPNGPVLWTVGDVETVNWNVANTDQTPVNCSLVDIYLSTDGGYTYPVLLKAGAPNNGSALVNVPNLPGNKNRVKVKGNNNYFFDISNANFVIQESPVPTYILELDKESGVYCSQSDTAIITKAYFTFLGGFSDTVHILVDSLPANLSAIVSFSSGIPSDSAIITIKEIAQLNPGTYTIYIHANSGNISKTVIYTFTISSTSPKTLSYNSPADNAKNVSRNILLSWNKQADADSYRLEVAKDPLFLNQIYNSALNTNQELLTNLEIYTVYYWRVFGVNRCGESADADVWSFQTLNIVCKDYTQPLDVTINPNNAAQVNSNLQITSNKPIGSLSVKVKLFHSSLSDLVIRITPPGNQSDTLFSKACPGLADMDATFSDIGSALVCQPTSPAVSGNIQAYVPNLSQYNNLNPAGQWRLRVRDTKAGDGGYIDQWSLNICSEDSSNVLPGVLSSKDLYVNAGLSGTLDSSYLKEHNNSLSTSTIVYTIRQNTKNGDLKIGAVILKVGDTFTQEDIDNKFISYQHNILGTFSDNFKYDVSDAAGNWDPGHTFNIFILQTLDATVSTKDLSCYNSADGEINITPLNGQPPYQYSDNGGLSFGPENTFKGLSAGSYSLIVKDSFGALVQFVETLTQPDSLVVDYTFIDNNVYLFISGGVSPYLTSLDGAPYSNIYQYLNLPNGTHTILVVDSNGCEKSITVVVSGVSTHVVNPEMWRVYPVPTHDILYIQVTKEADYTVELYDVTGRQVIKQEISTNINSNTAEISMAALSSGIYWLHLNSKDSNKVTKVILQK